MLKKSIVLIGDACPDTGLANRVLSLNPISQLIVVGSAEGLNHLPPGRFQSSPSLDDALQRCDGDYIFVVDKSTCPEMASRFFCVTHLSEDSIRVHYRRTNSKRKIRSFLLTLYHWICCLLLRINKHNFCPGICQISKQSLATLAERTSAIGSRWETVIAEDASSQATSHLLSLCKHHKIPIEETFEIGQEQTEPIRSKAIFRSLRRTLRFWWNSIMFPGRQQQVVEKPIKRKKRVVALIGLAVLTGLLFFLKLDYPLFEPDETRNAQLAANIIETGDWLSLRLERDHYWDKPPLQAWTIATSYRLFGKTPFTTRLPIAIASFLTVLLTVTMSRRLVGSRAAIIGGFVLLGSLGFSVVARYVTMDASLTLFTTIAFLAGYFAVTPSPSHPSPKSQRRKWRRYSALAGLACGLGLMTKGPVILATCLPPLLITAWLYNEPQSMLRKKFWKLQAPCFLIPAILVAAPWYVTMTISHPEFIGYFFWRHHVIRFTDAFNHQEPFWYYLVGIFIFMFPASYLLPSTYKFFSRRTPEASQRRTRETGFLVLCTIWIIFFFSLADAKLPTYILPAFPLISLLIGFVLHSELGIRASNFREKNTHRAGRLQKISRRAPLELVFWCTACMIALWMLSPEISYEMKRLFFVAIPVFVFATLATFFIRKPKTSWAAFGVGTLLFITVGIQFVVPAISQHRSILLAAKNLSSQGEFAEAPIVFFGRDSFSATLELPESTVQQFEHDELGRVKRYLESNPRAIVIADDKAMELLREVLPWSISIEKLESERHVFLTQLDSTIVARKAAESRWR